MFTQLLVIHDSYIIVKVALWFTETNLQLFKTAQSFPTSFPPAGYPALDTGRFYTGYIKEGLQDILQLPIFGITLCHRCNILFLNTKQQTHIHTHTCGNTTKFLFLVSEPAKVLSKSNNIFSKVLPLFCSDPKKLFTFWMAQKCHVWYTLMVLYNCPNTESNITHRHSEEVVFLSYSKDTADSLPVVLEGVLLSVSGLCRVSTARPSLLTCR